MIKNILLLTKISIRNYWENFNLFDGKNKKINKKSIYVWLLLIVIVAITYLSNEILKTLDKYDQLEIFPNILFSLVMIIMLIQTIIASMNILYFSKDLEILLSMPIKTEELLLSRTNTIINILYGMEILLMVIPLILYGIYIMVPIYYYMYLLFVLILLPIFPTLLVSIVTLICLNFIKFIKNKNKFQIITTLLLIAWIVLIEIVFIKGIISDQDNQELMKFNLNNIAEKINSSFIIIKPLISMLNNQQVFFNLLKVILVYIFMFAVLIYIGKKVYIKDILKTTVYSKSGHRENAKYRKSRHRENAKFDLKCKIQNPLKAYTKNEFKALFRHAIFFMQTIYPILLTMCMLIFLVIYFKISVIPENPEMFESLNGMHLTIEGVCIILGIIQILSSFINISITSISRQGKNAIFMKYIPINLYKQFLLKNVPQILVSSMISIIIVVLAKILFPLITVLQLILLIVIGIIMSCINSFLMLVVDLKRPILDWKTEMDVFKQNGNKIFQYVWTIAVILLLMYIRKLCEDFNIYIGVSAIGIVFLMIWIIINIIVKKQIKEHKLFKNII